MIVNPERIEYQIVFDDSTEYQNVRDLYQGIVFIDYFNAKNLEVVSIVFCMVALFATYALSYTGIMELAVSEYM
jgi:hypothetical protein